MILLYLQKFLHDVVAKNANFVIRLCCTVARWEKVRKQSLVLGSLNLSWYRVIGGVSLGESPK